MPLSAPGEAPNPDDQTETSGFVEGSACTASTWLGLPQSTGEASLLFATYLLLNYYLILTAAEHRRGLLATCCLLLAACYLPLATCHLLVVCTSCTPDCFMCDLFLLGSSSGRLLQPTTTCYYLLLPTTAYYCPQVFSRFDTDGSGSIEARDE